MSNIKFLTPAITMNRASSAYATQPHPRVSDRYVFVRTSEIIRDLDKLGWGVSWASESRVRDASFLGYQKHMLRFRRKNSELIPGNTIPEIVVVNGHTGRVGFKFMSGLFEVRCSNGLIVLINGFDNIAAHHSGYSHGELEKMVIDHTKKIDVAYDQIDNYKAMMLTLKQKMEFAEYVAKELKLKVTNELLQPRREDDKENSLWRVFNVIQENIMIGGISYKTIRNRQMHTRQIRSIDRNIKSNLVLWGLLNNYYNMVK